MQVKADAFSFANEVAIEACRPPSDNNPLASSEVTNQHFVPVRVVATKENGSTTAVAQIDPMTYVWMETNPTAQIGKNDVVPTSTIRDDAMPTPVSVKQMHIPPIQDLAKVIQQNQPRYQSDKVDLKAVDERVRRTDEYEPPRVDLRSRDECGRMKSQAVIGIDRGRGSIEDLEYKDSGTVVTGSMTLKQNMAENLQDDRKHLRARREGRPKLGPRPSIRTTGIMVSTLPSQDIKPIASATREENIARMIEDSESDRINQSSQDGQN